MVVGAPTEGTGAVYVYRRTGGDWALEERLGWSGAGAATRFGAAVATNGRDIVVGVPGAGSGTGAAVVFAGSGAGWAEAAVLQPEELADGAAFGTSLDVEGGLLAVGAPGGAIAMIPGTGGSGPLPGSVHIFDGESGAWSSAGRLEPPDPGPSAMGSSVAISGSEIFVGAPFSGQGAGGIYHFTRSGPGSAAWTLTHTIRPSEPVPASGFGMAVAADGDDIVVGTPLAGGGLGGGFAYRRDETGEWSEVADFGSGGPFNFYGLAVAVGGDVAVVGAPGADFFEGAGFLFRRTVNGWAPEGTIVDDAAGLEALRGEEREYEEGEAGGFTCSEVDLVAFVPVHDLGGERGMIANDLWGWTDPQSGREYAIMGRADGTTFIDLSNPGNPVYLGELPLTEGAITFEATARYDGINSAHNIVINEETGFAYVVGASGGGETCGGGLHMIDIRDPANPVFAGCFAEAGTGNADTGYTTTPSASSTTGPTKTTPATRSVSVRTKTRSRSRTSPTRRPRFRWRRSPTPTPDISTRAGSRTTTGIST